MVKTPKTRHSKPKREPVTIDHDPASVSRVNEPEQGASETVKPEQSRTAGAEAGAKATESDKKETGKEEAARTSTSAASSASSASSATGEKASAASAKPASGDASSSASGSGPSERKPSTGTGTGANKTEDGSADTAKRDSAGAKTGAGGPTGPSTGSRATSATPPPQRGSGTGAALAAGLLGGIVVLVLAGALQWTGVLPTLRPAGDDSGQSVDTLRQDVDSLRDDVAALKEASGSAGGAGEETTRRLDDLEGTVAGIKDTLGTLQASGSSDAAGGAGLSDVQDRLSSLETKVAELDEGNGDGQAVQDRLSELGQSVQSASSAASQASDRVAGLEDRVQALDERVENNDQQPRLALVMAASALKSAVERGTPFASELETYTAVAGDAEGVEELRPFAESGVPTRARIEAEASDAAARMIDASGETDAQGGVFDRLMASARSLVTVRPVGDVEGDSVAAIAARIERATREGDYDGALREYDTLPDEAKAAAGDFAEKLRARRAADRIVDQALSDALKSA